MKLVVGLGNPGRAYAYTKHNLGFLVVKELARDYRIKVRTKEYGSLTGRGRVGALEVALVMPVTYMNLSGKAIAEAIKEKGVDFKDLLVICDDINLRLGTIRMRTKGAAGGHKGLISIIEELGTGDFTRLRIGIATEAVKGDITEYVLSPFKRKNLKKAKEAIGFAKDAADLWVRQGPEAAMVKYNVRNRTYG